MVGDSTSTQKCLCGRSSRKGQLESEGHGVHLARYSEPDRSSHKLNGQYFFERTWKKVMYLPIVGSYLYRPNFSFRTTKSWKDCTYSVVHWLRTSRNVMEDLPAGRPQISNRDSLSLFQFQTHRILHPRIP